MKKQRLSVFILITSAFAAFTLGFFMGRNPGEDRISVSVPAAMYTQPAETVAQTEPLAETKETIAFPININTATEEEFQALPGIGEVLAQRIVAYRAENGNFASLESLMCVEGIGEKRMEDILDLITLGG